MRADPDGDPTTVYIGCPHNTYEEILYWSQRIDKAIKESPEQAADLNYMKAWIHNDAGQKEKGEKALEAALEER